MGEKISTRRQFYAAFCGNLLTASFGSSISWGSANFLELQKSTTTFPSGPLALKEATLMMSISYIGGIVGNSIYPHLAERVGGKRLMLLNGVPMIICWLLVIFAQNPYFLHLAVLGFGAVGSGQMISLTMFILEISHDNCRGTLNSFFDPSFNFGILFGFIIAIHFDYADQAKFHLILPIVYMLLFAWIPETPCRLLNQQKLKAANKSYKFFNGVEFESVPVAAKEIDAEKSDSRLRLSDFTNHRARKAICVTFALMCLFSLQGFNTMVYFVAEIFNAVNPDISPLFGSIVVSIIIITANLIFMNLVERANRRTFYICSSFAASVGLIAFASYLYFLKDNHGYDWIPIVCMSFILFVSSLGMCPVPFLVSMEILPKNIYEYVFSTGITLMMTNGFLLTELYPMLKTHIGLFGWIVFFAAMSFVNALVGIFWMPETKGKSHQQIMELLDQM